MSQQSNEYQMMDSIPNDHQLFAKTVQSLFRNFPARMWRYQCLSPFLKYFSFLYQECYINAKHLAIQTGRL